MTPREALVAARELLTPEGAWTQGAFARVGRGGNPIGPAEPRAKCFCIVGALKRVCPWEASLAFRALERAIGVRPGDVVNWNDTPGRTQAEVLEVLDKAIAGVAV